MDRPSQRSSSTARMETTGGSGATQSVFPVSTLACPKMLQASSIPRHRAASTSKTIRLGATVVSLEGAESPSVVSTAQVKDGEVGSPTFDGLQQQHADVFPVAGLICNNRTSDPAS